MPWFFVSEDSVEDGEEFSRDGDEGELLWFSGAGEALVEGLEGRVVAACDHCDGEQAGAGNLQDTEGRLDPPFYLWRYQASDILAALSPFGDAIEEAGARFKPQSDDELDREYPVISVSSDGKVTLNEYVRGEEFSANYRPKLVYENDFVYNPMRANIGSIGLVPKELDGALASPDYVVFRAKKHKPEFLHNLLRSPFYRMYIDVVSTGSIRDRLYFGDLQRMHGPDVARKEQSVVSELVRRADEEMQRLIEGASNQKDASVARLHDLIKTPSAFASDGQNLADAFGKLADQWRRETAMLSSTPQKVKHPAYRRIISMGTDAVPLILRELQERPSHWFVALREITGEDPAKSEGTSVKSATAAWLMWGRDRGLID